MPLTVERLRRAIVALAVLLLLTIVGSLFYGRWRLRHIAQDLPGRLGIQIQQSTKGFSLSQSNGQGRTLFTLHAARAVQFKSGGRVSLHDVEIDLYNAQDNQADTIAGTDFEFDPHSQIVQSPGEAHIVLHVPQTKGRAKAPGQAADQMIRVTTHGLVFNQKTGVATCNGEVDFQTAQSSGQAVGAEYDSKQGKLLLKSQLVLTTLMQDRPATLHAASAAYDRNDGEVHLAQPQYSSKAKDGITAGRAETAVVFLRNTRSAEQLNAQGSVQLESANGMKVKAAALRVLLTENNQPEQANFSGGTQFSDHQPAQQSTGSAQTMDVTFDAQGRANRVVLDRDVQVHQEMNSDKNHLLRTLTSNHLTMNLQPTRTGQAQLQLADAMGNAALRSETTVPGHAPQQTKLMAQDLKAKFAAGNQLQQINGSGNTFLQTVATNGDVDSTSGDTLQVEFASDSLEGTKGAGSNGGNLLPAQSIRTAVQTGHVILKQISKRKNGSSTATAQRAYYKAADDTLTLTGAPTFQDAQVEMTADRMQAKRTVGQMIALGSVQTTLRSTAQHAGDSSLQTSGGLLNANQPVHVIAEQAVLMHDTQKAVFSGRARLWQGDDTIEAPVIEVSQKTQTLAAYSDHSCSQCVISNFTGDVAGSAQSPNPRRTKVTGPSTFRILSGRMDYSDAERRASFLDHVEVISSDGDLLADQAEVFLTSPGTRAAANRTGSTEKGEIVSFSRNNRAQSSVERIVATGNVRLLQPGRRATGTRLVYTASDGYFVLTGDRSNPPSVMDAERGTVTGQTLTFASPDQAIIVDGATTTRTRVKKK